MSEKVKKESHTRLYLSAKNILKCLETTAKTGEAEMSGLIDRLIVFLKLYPVDLMIGVMKDMKSTCPEVYKHAIENEAFIESYFESYSAIR